LFCEKYQKSKRLGYRESNPGLLREHTTSEK
jgi:hypothetical protein